MIERVVIGGRRFLVPEVIQASALDCGPAALTSLLEGFGVQASYVRLQQACQTDLDGTSINTLEELAGTLGLESEQVMVPVDHVLLEPAKAIPALAVVTRDRTTHFVILWRRHGAFVQLMDPAKGRRWLRSDALRDELYIHEQGVPARAWRAWAGSPEFLGSLIERLRRLRTAEALRSRLARAAVADESWRSLALLDAATRMVAELVRAGGLRAGDEAGRVLETITNRAPNTSDLYSLVPERYWFAVRGGSDDVLLLRGAVLLRVLNRRDTAPQAEAVDPPLERTPAPTPIESTSEAPEQPFLEMWRLVADKQPMIPVLLGVGVIVAAAGALFEIMWLRGLLEISNVLSLRQQRLAVIGLLLGAVGALTLLDAALSSALLRLGRRAEARLRAALLMKLPRIGDGFQRRLVSDMAHRAHSIDALRGIPDVGARFARCSMQLVFTAIGLAWLDPPSAGIAIAAAVLGLAIPLATERMLAERELRQRSQAAALTRHYLDSLLGLVPARMHGAERPLRHQHERLLVEWGRSSLDLLRGSVMVEGVQLLVGSLLAAWLVLGFVTRSARPGSTLLLVYWTLMLPILARELAGLIRQFPAYRNILSRVLEPLRAPDEVETLDEAPAARSDTGVAVTFKSVQVCMRGRRVLDAVDLTIRPGEHVAIVGRSGAGKSSLAGLLLGWPAPTQGAVLVDGEALDPRRLAELRRETAWVDPAVHLWNRSFFDNLRYGDRGAIVASIGSIIEEASLGEVLEKMPSGLQSPLGEGGRLTSGGEGQRIRFGRALVRQPVRLAILDEPFRGLDRQRRHDLLMRARAIWREQTMLCVTHDIRETLSFERVLVLDEGRVVEDGDPVALSRAADSVYAALLKAEDDVQTTLWADGRWRRWRLENGVVCEEDSLLEPAWTAEPQILRGR